MNPRRPELAVPFANLVKWTRAHRLWQGQGVVTDPHQLATWLAGIGIRVPTGFGVSLMPLQSPLQAAMAARSVGIATGMPVVAGFGPGERLFQRAVLGRPYASPLSASREYVRAVRSLLAGEHAEQAGDYYPIDARLAEHPRVEVAVGMGVLRERMARVAGEVADVAITWLASAAHIGGVLLPAMRAADRPAGRPPPTVTAIVPVAVSARDRDATQLVTAACGAHLQAPHYRAALRKAGLAVTGDPHRDAPTLLDHGVFLYGTAPEIHARLAEFQTAGVGEVVLNTTALAALYGPRKAAEDLTELLT